MCGFRLRSEFSIIRTHCQLDVTASDPTPKMNADRMLWWGPRTCQGQNSLDQNRQAPTLRFQQHVARQLLADSRSGCPGSGPAPDICFHESYSALCLVSALRQKITVCFPRWCQEAEVCHTRFFRATEYTSGFYCHHPSAKFTGPRDPILKCGSPARDSSPFRSATRHVISVFPEAQPH